MSDFSARIQAILDTSKIPSQIAGIEKTPLTLRKITLETKNLPSQIQGSLDNHSFTIKLDGIKMANINSQATKAGQSFSQALVDGVRSQLSNGGIEASIARVEERYERFANSGHVYLATIKKDLEILNTLQEGLSTAADDKTLVNTYIKFSNVLANVRNNLVTVSSETKAIASQSQVSALNDKMSAWILNNTKASKEFGNQINDLKTKMGNLGVNVPISELNALEEEFKQLKLQVNAAGLAGDSFATSVKKSFKNISSYISIATVIRESTEVLQEMASNVLAVDTAMTGLYRVTELTDAQYKQLYSNMAKSAKDYGAELTDIIDSTTNWTKLGFEVNTSKRLAEVTTMYQQVADLDTKTAVNNLVTAYKGFEDQLLVLTKGDTVAAVELVADIFNNLGNKFAVEASDIGSALNNSASVLEMAGNTVQQSAGMATGIIEITQDAGRAGSALRTLTMRLRGTTAEELQALGEDAEGLIEVTSKLQATIKKQTGVDVVDTNNQLRSTFEIMRDLAGVWNTLDVNKQANVLEVIAGKNRASDVAALLNNWSQVEAAVESASGAAGTARKEYDQFLESLQAHLNRLETAWQKLSYSFMDVDLLKGGVDILVILLDTLDAIVNTLGSVGTVGAGVGLFTLFKNFKNVKTLFGDISLAIGVSKAGFLDFNQAVKLSGKHLLSFAKTPLGAATAIGILTTIIGAYIQYQQKLSAEQAKVNQELIDAGNAAKEEADKIWHLYDVYSDVQEACSENIRSKEDLTSATDDLLEVLGIERSEISGLVKEYGSLSNAINQITIDVLEKKLEDVTAGYSAAQSKLINTAKGGWLDTDDFGRLNFSTKGTDRKFADYLTEQGYFDSSWYNENADIFSSFYAPGANVNNIDGIVQIYDRLIEMRKKLDEGVESGLYSRSDLANSSLYKEINAEISMVEESYSGLINYIKQINDLVAEIDFLKLTQDTGLPKTKEEFDLLRQSMIDTAKASNQYVGSQHQVESAIDEFLGTIPEFSKFIEDISDLTYSDPVYLKFPALIRDTDGNNDDIDEIKKYIEDVKYLQDALSKLRKGKLTTDDQIELVTLHPELAGAEDLEAGIISLISGLKGASTAAESEATGITAVFDEMYKSIDPEDAETLAQFEAFKSLILSLFDTAEEGIPVFSSLSDAISGVSEASDLIAKAQEEMANSGSISLGTLQKLTKELGSDIGNYISIENGNIIPQIDEIKEYYTQAIRDMALEDKALEQSLIDALSGGFDSADYNFKALSDAMTSAQSIASAAASAQKEISYDTVESLREIFGQGFEQYIIKDSAGNYVKANIDALKQYARTMLQTKGASDAVLAEFDQMWQSTMDGSNKATTALDKMSDALSRVTGVSDYLTFLESDDLTFVDALEKAVKLLGMMGDGYSLEDFFTFSDGDITYNTEFLTTWLETYIDDMVKAGDVSDDFAKQMKAAAKAEVQQVNAIKKLTDAMSQVEKASDIIGTAQEEMAKKGQNSIQTIISLYEQFGEKANTMFSPTGDGGFIVNTDLVKQEMYALINTIEEASPEIKQAMKDALDVKLEEQEFEEIVDTYVSKIKTLQDALATLRSDGKLSDSSLYDLVKEFPKLATETDNLEEAITNLIGSMNTDVISEFNKQFGKVESEEDRAELQAFMDIVLKLGEVVGNTQFAIDINAETEGMQNLFDAMKESVSSTGLTAESIANLKKRYQDLESYDPARLFERTENGIHLNTKALRQLEKEYETLTKESIDNTLSDLVDQYKDLTTQIDNAGDAASTVSLYAQRNDILKQIEETSELAAQYAGLTSNFYKWEQAQSLGEEGDMYDSLTGSLKDIKELYKDGLIGTNKFRTAVQLMSDEDLSNATQEELLAAYEAGYPKMKRYFQDSSDGVLHFLHDVQKLNSEWVHLNKDGSWDINFGVGNDQEIADALGINVESVQAIMRKLSDYGFDINLDSMYSSLDTMQSKASKAAQKLKELGITDVDFNFNATNIDRINEQIEDAKDALKKFKNADGTINLSMEGAQEAQYVLATLTMQKQALETPLLLKVDANNIEGVVGETLRKLQTIKQNYNNMQLQAAIGADTSGIQSSINDTISSFTAEEIEILGKLGIDPTASEETINTAIANITPEMLVTVGVDDAAVTTFTETDHDTTATVVYNVDRSKVNQYTPATKYAKVRYTATMNDWNPPTKYGTVIYTVRTVGSSSSTKNNKETAAASGTAYAGGTRGNWGAKGSGVALGGELGEELVVRNGKFFTIGADSAEFFKYKKGDIIFNAAQTKEIFDKGRITSASPRGKALAEGTAFSSGSGSITGNGNVITNPGGGGGSGSSSGDSDDSKIIDWIEIAIDRIERAINKLGRIAQSAYKTLAKRLHAGDQEISKVEQEINVQNQGYNRYMQQANSVGLSNDLKEKVRNGTININEYDGDTAKLIEEYQQWYEKAMDCADAVDELHETLASLYEEKFNNISTDFNNQISLIEQQAEGFNASLSEIEAHGYLGGSELYNGLIDAENDKLNKLKAQLAAQTQAMNEAVNSGEIDVGSEAWYAMQTAINETKLAIQESEVSLVEFNNALREMEWGHFDYLQERISQITKESEFMINLLSNSDQYTDKGQLTDAGMATIGLHGVNYNTYLAQAEQYAEEIRRLDQDLAEDPHNRDLIARREELLALQQESIMASEAEKQAIIDMVQEGINLELSSIKELIDAYTDSLDSAKDLYDYQKKVKKQTAEVASLQKQLAAYQGDTSEENRARLQKLEVDLSDAMENLEETQYDRYIKEQKRLLDDFYADYEETLNQRLDNVDALISDMIDMVNANSDDIANTIISECADVGYTLSDSMSSIWLNGGAANGVIATYGNSFEDKLTNINAVISRIGSDVGAMVNAGDNVANSNRSSSRGVQGYSEGGYIAELQKIAMRNGDDIVTVNTLKKGEAVLTPQQTDALSMFAKQNLSVPLNVASRSSTMSRIVGQPTQPLQTTNNQNHFDFNMNIDYVEDYEDLFYKMQHDPSFEKMVQAMTVDQMFGGSKLAKYKVRV